MTTQNNSWNLDEIAKAFDKAFADAPEPAAAGAIPEGKYTATVTEVEIRTSKAGLPYINWRLTISDGEYAGRTLWRTNSITENTVEFLKRDLRTCGIAITSLRELDLKQLLDLRLSVQVKNQKDDPSRQNVYLNDCLGRGFGNAAGAGATAADGDIPF